MKYAREHRMHKLDFIQVCLSYGISEENAQEAWKKIENLQKKIRNNWNLIEQMRDRNPSERLSLRKIAAEAGIEYTPSEVDDLINVIGLIQDQMEYEEN